MGLNLSRGSPGAWRKDPRPSVKGCKDRAKAPGKSVCVCVDSLVLWTANTAHKGVLKITSVMCILRWRERDNLWGWWVMGKEKKSLKRREMKDTNFNGLSGSPMYRASPLKPWYWKWERVLRMKRISARPTVLFFLTCVLWHQWSLDQSLVAS